MTLLNQDLSGPSTPSTLSTAGLLEKIEILRSALRWASRLERPDIEKLLRQANALRHALEDVSGVLPSDRKPANVVEAALHSGPDALD